MTKRGVSPKTCMVAGCHRKSIPGFKPGVAFCRHHWAEVVWGNARAAQCRDREEPDGVALVNDDTMEDHHDGS